MYGHQKELEHLREVTINYYGHPSLYDILTMDANEMSKIVTRMQFRKIIESEDFDENFPAYGFMLKLQSDKGILRRKVFKRLEESLIALSGIPYGCSEMIFDYLNSEDLKNVAKASLIVDGEEI